MTLGRKNGKIKIKTDGDAGLRAVECGCCGGCGGCPALEDVLTSTSFIATSTSSGSPKNNFSTVGCADGNVTIRFSLAGCNGPYLDWEDDLIVFEGSFYYFGFGVGISIGYHFANNPSFTGDPSKCYVVLSFGGSDHFFLVSGENSVDISGTYHGEFIVSCDYISPEDCPGDYIPEWVSQGGPPQCLNFPVNATLTIS